MTEVTIASPPRKPVRPGPAPTIGAGSQRAPSSFRDTIQSMWADPEKYDPAQPFAHQPFKAIYCFQRVLSALLLLPLWALYYSLFPRPRPSWSLSQTLLIRFTRRVNKMTEVANLCFATRDPKSEPDPRSLKETQFRWVPALRDGLRTGVVNDVDVKRMHPVGVYVWPKWAPPPRTKADDLERVEEAQEEEEGGLVGLYFHGGGYAHMSAHETSQTSAIPRRLVRSRLFREIHSVEYRLISSAPFPGALQDAAAVYASLVEVQRVPPHRIVLIGDSAGGNLALALARWVRDEGRLGMMGGLLLLSPWCDPSHSFPYTPSSHIPRPNYKTDYLVDTPAPRSLLVHRLLGKHRTADFVHSPYISPASPRLSQQVGLHRSLPRTFISLGTAERLEAEIEALIFALERDAVPLTVHRAPDAPHDPLILRFWDKKVSEDIWKTVGEWLEGEMSA